MKIELTAGELRAVQRVLSLLDIVRGTADFIGSQHDIAALKNKIDNCVGDPYRMAKKLEIQTNMRKFYADDPEELKRGLAALERDYPTPPAYADTETKH